MARRTLDQLVAHLDGKLKAAQARARAARTHRLIVFGGKFASVLDDWDKLPAEVQDRARSSFCAAVVRAAHNIPEPLAPPPPLGPPQPEPAPAGDGDDTLRPPA